MGRPYLRDLKPAKPGLFLSALVFAWLFFEGPASLTLLPRVREASAQGWYNAAWSYRKKITIDQTKVGAGGVSNFPVLILRTDTDLQSKAQASGNDILFTSSDGTTKLSHEIERYTSGTGELIAWVKVPSVSAAAPTDLYMYYGNASATNQQDAANVWDTNYKGVWHLKEDPLNSATSGLKGDCYDGMAFNTFVSSQTDLTVNFNPADTVLGTNRASGPDTFSCRWKGFVKADFTQTYTFYTTSDDGVRLWVNGVQVINNWTDHAPTENSGTISLTAGQWYPITLEFYENGGGAVITLSYSSASVTKQIIPSTNLALANSVGDSTANNNTGTFRGDMNSANQVAGKIGGALNFDGVNDAIQIPDSASLDVTTITVSAWVKKLVADVPCWGMIVSRQAGTGSGDHWILFYYCTASDEYSWTGSPTDGASTGDVNTWVHLVGTLDGTTSRLYKNGVQVASGAAGGLAAETSSVCIAAGANDATRDCTSELTNAVVDEVRISSGARSAGWILTEYNNQNSPSTFYTVGAEEGAFTKLQLLVPGETAAPGTPSGKTGTPTAQTAGTAFTVTVNAVDANWNVRNDVTDTVGITSSDANATLPANAALVAGTRTFSVTLNTAGTATVTASDITQPAKTPNTSPPITVNAPPPFVSGYTFRRLIDITDALVSSGPHTNFPMLFCVTLLDLRTTANGGKVTDPQGDDIIFTASDGTTQLAHEVEKYVATTGELIAWVRVPSLAATSTLYMYYGNSAVTTFQGSVPGSVWDSNYQAVWHLKETTGGADAIKDSTSNARHGTDVGSPTLGALGQVDGAIDFGNPNTTRRVDTKNFMSSGVTAWTAQAWVYKTATKDARIVYKNNAGNTGAPVFGLASGGTDLLRCRMRNSVGTIVDFSAGTIPLSTWTFVACTYDGANVRVYKNGVLEGTTAITGTLAATADVVVIAQNEAGTSVDRHWPGRIDEARVSNTARSTGWITTEYNNQSACAGFFTVGAEETGVVTPGGFNAYETATAAGAITGVIKTRIAGASVSLDMIALNVAKTAIATTFTGTVRVEVLNASNNSGALDGNNCRPTWTVVQTLSPDPAFAAPDNGRKAISFTEANSYPDARLRITYPAGAPTVTGCSTDNFAIRPNTFSSFSVTDTDWQTAGTGRALNDLTFGTVTHKAGRPLSVRATALNAAGTPATTTNYVGAPTATLTACAAAACTATFGALTLTTTFVAGQLASDVASYNNVGSFWLQLVDSAFASVDAADGSTTTERNITSAVNNVGRFVPDHFAVSLNTPVFGTACGAGGFTYVGQTFNYTTAPVITVTAQDFANNTTTLYADATKWWRITNASLTGKSYTAAAGTLDSSGITGTDPVIAVAGSGMGTLTFSSGTGLFFTRTTPVAPFNADISLALNVIDADGVILASNPARFGTATAGNGIAFSSGKPMRFGRLALRNANGSQLVPLPVQLEAQYWLGAPTNAFVTNTADSCTSIAAGNVAMSNFTQNLAACETAISGGGMLSAGRKTLQAAAPGSANNGSVDLTVNLGASASGNTCTAVGAGPGPLTTTANLPYLQGNWTGGAYNVNPSARATFGVFKGSEEVIFIRENF